MQSAASGPKQPTRAGKRGFKRLQISGLAGAGCLAEAILCELLICWRWGLEVGDDVVTFDPRGRPLRCQELGCRLGGRGAGREDHRNVVAVAPYSYERIDAVVPLCRSELFDLRPRALETIGGRFRLRRGIAGRGRCRGALGASGRLCSRCCQPSQSSYRHHTRPQLQSRLARSRPSQSRTVVSLLFFSQSQIPPDGYPRP